MTALLLCVLQHATPLEDAAQLIGEARFEEVEAVLAPLLADPHASPTARARGEVLRGLAAHNLLDEAGARAAFARALALDRTVRLPAGASPRAMAVFEAARAATSPVEPARPTALAPPPAHLSLAAPASALRPTRVAALVAGGVALALGVSGAVLTGAGIDGRATAVAEPQALLAAQRFDDARSSYAWGTGLLFSAAAALLSGVVLFVMPTGG